MCSGFLISGNRGEEVEILTGMPYTKSSVAQEIGAPTVCRCHISTRDSTDIFEKFQAILQNHLCERLRAVLCNCKNGNNGGVQQ